LQNIPDVLYSMWCCDMRLLFYIHGDINKSVETSFKRDLGLWVLCKNLYLYTNYI